MLPFNRILLPTDFSSAAFSAERRARSLARLFGAELDVLHVTSDASPGTLPGPVPDEGRPLGQPPRPRFRHMLAWLTDERASMKTETGTAVHVRRVVQESDRPARAILRYARSEPVDLIVMGTKGRRALRGPLLGSVVERVVRDAPCGVVTVRPDTETDAPPETFPRSEPEQRVLVVPVDLKHSSRRVLSAAKHLASRFMSTIDLVHVMSPDASWPRLGASCEQAHSPVREAVERRTEMQRAFEQADGPDVSVACNILFGRPGRAIVSYIAAQQARLVLMTPGPAKGMRTAVLGGITDHVLRHARCPVLALPGVYENAARIVKDEPAGPGTLDRRHRSA